MAVAEERFTRKSGQEVFTGNELLVKGCLEAEGGTHLWTGYPGSPVSGFFDAAHALRRLLRTHGIRVTIANNEALAAAMINGSQMAPLRAISVQKSVGVHVAADALALGNLVGAHPEGGAIIVLGDDPWSDSTQVPADSRFLARHLLMPVMEPADPQEIKDWIDLAFKLSRESELYIGYLVNTNQADGGGSVQVRPNQWPQIHTQNQFDFDVSKIDFDRNVLLPPRTWWKEETIHQRYQRLWQSARRHGVHQWLRAENPPGRIGFISAGEAYAYLRHALTEMGLDGVFPILKLGITFPVDPNLVREFFQGLEHIIVVEQRRPFLEEQIVAIAQDLNREKNRPVAPLIWGKRFPQDLPGIPAARGLNPSILIERLGHLFQKWDQVRNQLPPNRITEELTLLNRVAQIQAQLPPRTPTFCPGCPHRDTATVLMEIQRLFRNPDYMRRVHGRDPVDLVFHGDTGCYTMLMFEPTKDLMHNYSGMGLGGGTGAGIDPFIRNKQVVFMGDSTFFHSGMIAISNSLKNNQDITYIILDNQTTAMTGHQTTPGREEGVLGEKTFAQRIDEVVKALTRAEFSGATVLRVNPEDYPNYRQILEKTILQDGVKIIIAEKECGITFHRRRFREEKAIEQKLGYLPEERHINIDPDVCEGCLECTRATGCPGLTFVETPFGRKIQIDRTWCVDDGSCTRFTVPLPDGRRVKPCPAFEEVRIRRSQPPASPREELAKVQIPLPSSTPNPNPHWRLYFAGVGGMGVGTVGAIVVLAANRDGYRVLFCDKKGLAIRNGTVYSMITLTSPDAPYTSNIIPYGKANVLIGLDLLEAARVLDSSTNQRIGSPQYTGAIVNTHVTPTILSLLGKDVLEPARYEAFIRQHTDPNRFFACPAGQICERFFGTQKAVNLVLLGVAYQRGEIPIQLETLEWAIRKIFGPLAEENLEAFRLGRWIAHDPDAAYRAAQIPREPTTFAEIVQDKTEILRRRHRWKPSLASRYRQWMDQLAQQLALPDELLAALALRVYDLIEYEDLAYAEHYVHLIRRMAETERHIGHAELQATAALIHNLHRVMAIKDEIYVADLLTREEKYRRDRIRFRIDPARGDRITYRHFNQPSFRIFGRELRWNIVTRDWMLRLFRHAKWLRRLLPEWHREEREFRDWYFGLVERCLTWLADPKAYSTVLTLLRLPEQVTGYREIRYPKMDQARAEAERLLQQLLKDQHPKPHQQVA